MKNFTNLVPTSFTASETKACTVAHLSAHSAVSATAISNKTYAGVKTFKGLYVVMLSVAFTLLLSNNLKAQTITVDGNPSDWPAVLSNASNLFKAHVPDVINSSSDNVWAGGSKVDNAVSGWSWGYSNTNDKTDMRNTGVALVGHKLYVFADIYGANGDASIGFWIFRGGAAPLAGGSFSGVHQDGDLLICMFFTHGHSTATPAVYKWSAGSLVAVSLGSGAAGCATNSSTLSVPTGWSYSPKSGDAGTYPATSFFEGYVDLDSTGTTFTSCFNSYLALTWQSQSMSSSMADLAFGQLPVLPSASMDNRTVCNGMAATFNAYTTGGTAPYQYSWNGASYTSSNILTISPATSSATEIVIVKDANGCLSVPDTAQLTVTATPNVNAVANVSYCNGNSAPAINFSGSAAGTTFSWSGSTNVGFGSTGTGNIAAFTAVNTGTTTLTDLVTVTPATAGCSGTPTTFKVTVNPSTAAGTFTGTERYCVGSSVTYTAAISGGTWTSSATAVVTVSATGVATGIAQGTAKITYTVTTSCGTGYTTKGVTVNPLPFAGSISGTTTLCSGTTVTLTRGLSSGDGSWSSSSPATASVNSSGVVSGVNAGTATISFTTTNSCGTARSTIVVTVNPLPAAGTIAGNANICPGSVSTLTDAVEGGVWSSGSTGIATINTMGVVAGIAQGTANISYTVTNSCGTARAVKVVTVNALPAAGTIAGTANVCAGSVTTLSDAVEGGVWSSGATTIATVNTAGIVTGVAQGTATISYTKTNSCGSANATRIVTVNPLPSASTISGSANTCVGSATTLTAVEGGVWSSGATSIATVNAVGVVTGIAQGTATISYTITNSCGSANATRMITVNPLPVAGAITGLANACAGSVTPLANATSGGAWSTASTDIATINATGVVTGIAAGTTTITYTVTNSCGMANATQLVTINPLPNAGVVTGIASVCEGSTTLLNNATVGGAWSSASAATASVDGTGVVTGIAAGTVIISYTVTNSCGVATKNQVVTVNPLPLAGSINGTTSLCAGAIGSLTNAVSGGVWSAASTDMATVDATGVVTGIAAGTATISYTVTNSCGVANATQVVIVNPLPVAGPINGTTSMCAGAITSLTDAVSGGTWSSASTDIATVDAAGVVAGVAAGSTTISYTVTNSCGATNATEVVIVNPLPPAAAINGTAALCAGTTDVLNTAVSGGVWTSGATDIATVDATGVITAMSAGTVTISYTVTNSCGVTNAIQVVTVNPLPPAGAINGTAALCAGTTNALDAASAGGVWSSEAAGIASVDATGVVTGISAGTVTISYTVTNSCGVTNATQVVTVNPLPNAGAITGSASLCAGATITLANAAGSGAFSSVSAGIASVDAAGVVTGISAGTATISYTATNSCGVAHATKVVTVNPLPNAGEINGTTALCAGATAALENLTNGGAWSSVSTGIASVDATGVVTGISAGTATITYTVTDGCGVANVTRVVTVNPLPVAGIIEGAAPICAGTTIALNNTTMGGTWSSAAATGIASVDASGVVTGISAGTAAISYTVTNGCGVANTIRVVTINPLPAAGTINGMAPICAGTTVALSNTVAGGVWSSAHTAIASISAAGVVTGSAAGTATISYTVTTGCGSAVAAGVVTINPLPVAGSITGVANVCAGSATTLADAATGGVWSSVSAGIATVNASGVVTGVTSGTTTISYTVTNGCGIANTTRVVTVNPLPNAGTINGAATICEGTNRSLSNMTPGGAWTSGTPAIATVSPSGIVTAVAAGIATISYTVTNSWCSASAVTSIPVNPRPYVSPIIGSSHVRYASDTTLTDSVAGGTWSASNTYVTVTGGLVRGVHAGTATISYAVTNSCGTAVATKLMTVDSPRVYVSAITGASFLTCAGSTSAFWNATSGGTFSIGAADTSVARTTPAGLVTGVSAGTATLSYTYMGSTVTSVLTVYPVPAAITGSHTVCNGRQTTLADVTPGGVWTSSIPSIATIGAAEGVVTAANPGVVPMYYTLVAPAGCRAQFNVTVNPNPATIAGPSSVCIGSVITLTDITPGGTWCGTNTHASIDLTGHVTGISVGGVDFTYTLGTGCYSTKIIGINSNPTPINGKASVCTGLVTFLSDASTTAMSWTSSTPAIATISASGAVTGVTAGTTTITFKVTTGCYTTTVVTVNALPSVTAILGASSVSVSGGPVTLSDLTPGGVWSSDRTSTITVGSATGLITAVAATGTANIKYLVTNSFGCSAFVTRLITATATTTARQSTSGNSTTVGSTIELAADLQGGEWTSSDNNIATVDENGTVTAIAEGSVSITHTSTLEDGQVSTEVTNVMINSLPMEADVMPNPNKGSFVVKGTTGTTNDATIRFEITNMTGQIVHRGISIATGGIINERFNLDDKFPSGMYVLIVHCSDQRKTFNFVVEK